MPNLVGLPVLSAEIALSKVGIKSATPVYESVPVPPVGSGNAPPVLPIKPGSVIAQTPAAGARVDQSTIVKLTAAK
jgi:beta-lactam-binding protein with PASTA domain